MFVGQIPTGLCLFEKNPTQKWMAPLILEKNPYLVLIFRSEEENESQKEDDDRNVHLRSPTIEDTSNMNNANTEPSSGENKSNPAPPSAENNVHTSPPTTEENSVGGKESTELEKKGNLSETEHPEIKPEEHNRAS